jgi:hypothetical protein
MMHHWKTRLAVVALVVAFTATLVGSPALATDQSHAMQSGEKPSGPAMVFDLVLGRPFGLAAMVVGTGLFFVSLPFSALGGNSDVAFKKLVLAPGKFTFSRPLGEGTQPDPNR